MYGGPNGKESWRHDGQRYIVNLGLILPWVFSIRKIIDVLQRKSRIEEICFQ
jgi:hypothetical protein